MTEGARTKGDLAGSTFNREKIHGQYCGFIDILGFGEATQTDLPTVPRRSANYGVRGAAMLVLIDGPSKTLRYRSRRQS
jgi:hypothetical protein